MSGDNLSKTAKPHYGNGNKYFIGTEANKPMLRDPDKFISSENTAYPATF